MESLLNDVLSLRGEERKHTLITLAELLADTELGENLELLEDIVAQAESLSTCLTQFEMVIVKNTYELLRRMGVEIDLSTLYESPQYGLWVLETINETEEYEDIDTLATIVAAEEDATTVLVNLVTFMVPDIQGDFHSAIDYVEPRLIRTIVSNIEAKKIVDENEVSYASKGRRLLNYVVEHDDLPFISTFENFNHYSDLSGLIGSFDYASLTSELNAEMITKITIATCLALYESYEEAKPNLETIVGSLEEHQSDVFTLHNYTLLGEALEEQYKVGLDEEG